MSNNTILDDAIRSLDLSNPMSVRGIEAARFGDALGHDTVLLVFLRHFG